MEEFFARLREHKLVQWTLAYVAVSFAIIPVLDIIAERFGWSGTAVRCIIIALVTGFLVMLVIAWYHGERGEQRITRTEHAILAVLLVLGGLTMWRLGPTGVKPVVAKTVAAVPAVIAPKPLVVAAIDPKSVAVLPFENLSDDKNNAYFADGMQDLILTKLADIGDLKVISRTSTAKYTSHPDDLKAIAQQLGVATILEGTVQKAGNQVLINVQLIDAQTDNHLWAEAYPRTLDNIFGVEGEVAQKVADALKAKLTPAETAHVAHVPTTNAAAYDLFLKGEYDAGRAESSRLRADYAAAIADYRAAVQQDSQFALAWASMAVQQLFQLRFTGEDGSNLAAHAKTAIDHALALAPHLMEAYLAQGYYRDYVQHDLDGALTSFDTALRIKPQSELAIFAVAVIQFHRGQYADAIANLQRASALNPRATQSLWEMAASYMALRRYPEAEQVLRQAVAIDPTSMISVNSLAYAYAMQGDLDRGTAVLDAAPASLQSNSYILMSRAVNLLYGRHYADARQLLAELKPGSGITAADIERVRGDVEWASGDPAAARPHYLRAAALLEEALRVDADTSAEPGDLGWAYARLGRTRDALKQGQLGITLHPMDKDVIVATRALWNMARIQAQVGHVDAAIAGLDHLLSIPAGNNVSVPFLNLDTDWDPIRQDPRFQALLQKYAGSEAATDDTSHKVAAPE